MHTHLVTFQVVGRTPFDVDAYQALYGGPEGVPGGIDPTDFATGSMLPPDPTERGFKDTVKANPGYFTTIRAKFDLPSGVSPPQGYVYHCHILEHEDNDPAPNFFCAKRFGTSLALIHPGAGTRSAEGDSRKRKC